MISNAFSLHFIKECTILYHHSSVKMSTSDWILLDKVRSLNDVKDLAKLEGLCQCRITNLKNSTKYSFKCSEYRKYPLCSYELKAVVNDDDQDAITVMSRNIHSHEIRKEATRLPSPVRESVSKYVNAGLSQPQIRIQPLGKRKTRGRPKKVGTALHCN